MEGASVLKSQGRMQLSPREARSLHDTRHFCTHSQEIPKQKQKRGGGINVGPPGPALGNGVCVFAVPCSPPGNQGPELSLVAVSFWSGRKGNPAAAAYVPMQHVVPEMPSRG